MSRPVRLWRHRPPAARCRRGRLLDAADQQNDVQAARHGECRRRIFRRRGAVLLGSGLIQKRKVGCVAKLSLPHQYRVRDGQQAFPSFERHSPKRTCLPDYGPLLPACGITKLAFYIRLRRAL